MPPHTPHHGAGLTWTDRMAALGGQSAFLTSYVPPSPPAPSRARRPDASRIAGAVAPLSRCAVVVLSAGLLLGGDPAAAASERFVVSDGQIVAPAAQRAMDARAAALGAEAHGRAEESRAEALAVAAAALEAAAAVEPLISALPPEQAPGELAPAVERLSSLVSAATPAGARVGDPVVLARTADERLRLSGELADSAAEVFRLSMQVESRTQEAAAAEAADLTLGLQVLEESVASAADAVAELGDLEPLVPLPPTVEVEVESLADGPAVPTLATTSRARLSTDAPEGVAGLVERWTNGAIPTAELCPVPFARGALLQCDAAEALVELNAAYRAEHGTDLQVVSSYRTFESQVTLKAAKGFLAATPGASNHGWGLAVDFGGIGGLGEFDSPGYRWLQENAEAFGWHHPRYMEPGGSGPQEPWHWEFGTA